MAPTAGTRLRFKQAKAKKPHHATKKIPSLKNRIRALDRFLKRGGLDDATRASKQRELKELQDEFNKKEMTEQEKQNAEKYKKIFVHYADAYVCGHAASFLRARKAHAEAEEGQVGHGKDKAEKKQLEQEFERHRHDLMYIYYFPKLEQYISLFPSTAHDEEKLKRQEGLHAAAIARFEKEQPTDAFHQFCYNDGKTEEGSSSAAAAGSSKEGAKHVSAADLLLKKPSKAEQKKKSKKPQSKKDKDAKDKKKKETKVLADIDDDENIDMDGGDKTKAAEDDDGEEDEHDDFFL
ncbi:Rna-processing protein, partial [Globisporangium splendens]